MSLNWSALDFGNVPAWGSTVIALVGLLFVVLGYRANHGRKQRRRKERTELEAAARRVAVSPHSVSGTGMPPGFVRVTAEVFNSGDLPITNVFLRVHSLLILQDAVFASVRQLNAGMTLKLDQVVAENPDQGTIPDSDRLWTSASFTDSDGWKWQRWADGVIRPPIDMSPRGPWSSRFNRIRPIAWMVEKWRRRDGRPPLRAHR